MNQVWTWIIQGIAHLVSGIKAAAAGIVGKVLATFGLSIVTFEAILPPLKAFMVSMVSGLPAQLLQFLGAIRFGEAVSMILSALAVRMAWKVFIVPTSIANQLPGGGS